MGDPFKTKNIYIKKKTCFRRPSSPRGKQLRLKLQCAVILFLEGKKAVVAAGEAGKKEKSML